MSNKFELLINKRGQTADFSWLNDLQKVLAKKFKIKSVISVALVDETEIQEFNRVYRHKNKITDVLSFQLDSEDILGEVVICLDQARRQAKEAKKTFKSELQQLTIHGILHLLGYDHELNAKEAKRQQDAEQGIYKIIA
jgi:probable rRNA maturation factor